MWNQDHSLFASLLKLQNLPYVQQFISYAHKMNILPSSVVLFGRIFFFFKGLLVNKRGCNFNFRDCCNPSSLSSDNLNANCHATLINLSAPAFYLAYYELFLVQIFLHAKMSYLAWSLFVLSCFFSLPTFSIVSIFSSFLLLMTLSKNAVLFWWN